MLNEELQIKLELDNEKVQAVLHEEILRLGQKIWIYKTQSRN